MLLQSDRGKEMNVGDMETPLLLLSFLALRPSLYM